MAKIIGDDTALAGAMDDANARVYWARFQALSSGKITTIKANISYGGYEDGGKITFAVYSDNSGAPDARLATCSEVTFSSSGMKSAVFDLDITSGTYYWLAVACNHSAFCKYIGSGGTHKTTRTAYPYTWPDPAPTSWATSGSFIYVISGWATDAGSPMFAYAQQ